METAKPAQQVILTQSGIPTGSAVGFQVQKAVSGTVAIGRTTAGVQEQPVGSGNFIIVFNAPPTGDTYLVIIDWNGGVIDQLTSRVIELRVSASVESGSTGLGAIADYAKMHMGGETWNLLSSSANFGDIAIARAIALVKDRIFTTPPDVNLEESLPSRVLDYAGISVALQLVNPARDLWAQAEISRTVGDDPAESVTYANRAALMDSLRDDLMRLLPAAQAAAIPLIDTPVIQSVDGPAIDEEDDCKVTSDPRDFPRQEDFPGSGYAADLYGVDTPRTRRSGVIL